MAAPVPGTAQFAELATTPSAPNTGYSIIYMKSDHVLYIQNEFGIEVAIGTASGITSLTGDVTATGPGAAAATVNFVGGATAANIASATAAYLAATSSNTPNTLVLRDGSGNFSAGVITANLTGNVNGVDPALHGSRHSPTGADPVSTAAAVTQLPDQANAVGTSADLSRADHVHNIPSGSPVQIGTANFQGVAASFALSDHIHSHGAQTNATLHAIATAIANGFMSSTDKAKLDASTSSNTPSTLVQRDASGNFSASIITADLTGNVSGSAASFTGPLLGDVTGTQGATVISSTTVTSKLLTGYVIGANTPIAATDSILQGFEKLQGQVSAGAGANITSLTGDVTATGPGAAAATIAVGAVTDTKASLAVKPAVTVAATTNQALTGTPVIDGQATAVGSIILLTAQTTGSENGPWVAAAGAWSRPTWYPSGGTTQSFQFITTLVRLGTIYQGSVWRMTTSGAIIIDTTSTTWVVTPTSGNYKSSYKIGPQTGSSEVDLVFSNANNGTLGWNPSTTITLVLPPASPTAGTYLANTATPGILEWSNPLVNIDGGRPDSVYTSSQFINGGTP